MYVDRYMYVFIRVIMTMTNTTTHICMTNMILICLVEAAKLFFSLFFTVSKLKLTLFWNPEHVQLPFLLYTY